MAISIILWYLGSHSSNASFKNAEKIVAEKAKAEGKVLEKSELENITSTYKLENSYIGKIGKTIEPAIRPLGYDWKIGIAVVTSFAAREVFVGTLATIYKNIQLRNRCLFIAFLCFCNAMCQYACHNKKRNQHMEMANYSIGFYEWICIYNSINHLSNSEINLFT